MTLQQKKPHQYSLLNWVETHFLNEDTIIQIKYVAIALICESKIVITTTRNLIWNAKRVLSLNADSVNFNLIKE